MANKNLDPESERDLCATEALWRRVAPDVLADVELTLAQKLVALALLMDVEPDGAVRPDVDHIADTTTLCRRTVVRAVDGLVAAGWAFVDGDGWKARRTPRCRTMDWCQPGPMCGTVRGS